MLPLRAMPQRGLGQKTHNQNARAPGPKVCMVTGSQACMVSVGRASSRQVHRALCQLGLRRGVSGRSSFTTATQAATSIFQTDEGSWVVAPPSVQEGSVKGVVHFLGGAFAGAAPQVLYSLLLDLLAEAGYVVITTPYAVTFRHLECTKAVRAQFLASLEELKLSDSLGAALKGVPVFGVGHSNGALLHSLLGANMELLGEGGPEAMPKGHVIMSYNNLQVGDAIPIPGLMASLPAVVQSSRSASFQLPQLPSSSELLQQGMSLLPPELRDVVDGQGQVSRAALALDQLASVVNEVGDGATDFTPTPAESRAILRAGYQLAPTLTIRFENDNIDETPELSEILRRRLGTTGLTSMTLPGTHLTPCGGDLWRNGGPDSSQLLPASILASLVRDSSQADVRRLGLRVTSWLNAAASKGRA